jgi:arylsulfatase A
VIFEDGRIRTDTKGRYGEDLWLDFLGGFMERHRKEPFFAYYSMALTHGPFTPTPKSASWESGNRLKDDPRNYKDMVEYMDECVGRLIARIDALGLRSNTLVLFYADNGTPREITTEWRGKPFRGGKGLTTEAGMHVPLIANWPGTAKRGAVCGDLIDSTDFVPTIAAAAGIKPLEGAVDGRSFLPQIRGERGAPREIAFAHYDPHPGCKVDFKATRLAWDKQWKLYRDGRLFDYAADPLEEHPVEGRPEVRQKLQAELDRMERVKPAVFNKYSAYGAAY